MTAPQGRPRPRTVPPADPWLTVAEVARQLRVSKMTVYRLVNGGELRSVRVGRSFRIRASWFRKWLAAQDSASW